ncbi:MAG: hypothetical protein LBK04_00895 [Clostridiales Family XIII bacterium]|jgi:hypothetical protein|nr:hypothetical protein [Clostridiales Family XIII bacterium]
MSGKLITDITGLDILSYEKTVLTESETPYLLPRTLIRDISEEGVRETLHWNTAGLMPLTRIRTSLADMFFMMGCYIKCVDGLCDLLLNPENIVSAPDRVFVSADGTVRVVYDRDPRADIYEKICFVASYFASQSGVAGAEPSFNKFIEKVSARKPSLGGCLRACETIHREWNRILNG